VATRTTGSSARQLQHDLGLSYQTAWTWCHKIRKAMEDRDTRYSLQGMIELDDTYIGGKKKPGKRGRGARSKVPVMVAVESRPKGCGHVALQKMETFSSHEANSFLHQKVYNDSLIISDGLHLYRPLGQSVNLCQVPLTNGHRAIDVLPHVHRVIARLKTWIRGTHSHVSSKHLDRYLAEFSYRFNRRFKDRRVTIFDRLTTACCVTPAVTYRQLVADLSG
jgi:transposase-like protein